MSQGKNKSEDERACDRILIELGARDAKLASSLTEWLSKSEFAQKTTFEKKLEKVKLLGKRQPDLLREIVAELKKGDGPAEKTGTISPLVRFLERMPNLKGAEITGYAEYTGGNYRSK